jgi:DNA-binding response OmpR family regulator
MKEEEENVKMKVNEVQHHQNCEIVALTSFTDKTTYDVCLDIGIKEVINKPIHVQELLRIILMYGFKLTLNQYKHYL